MVFQVIYLSQSFPSMRINWNIAYILRQGKGWNFANGKFVDGFTSNPNIDSGKNNICIFIGYSLRLYSNIQ